MKVNFFGAAGMVTGSMHLVEAGDKRILLDCGMIQGGADEEARNAEPFPFDVAGIDALVVSHAHIDHTGRLPLLAARGYRGPIYTQQATAELLEVMLFDSASLQESDAKRSNRKRARGEPEAVPLYTREDVQKTMALVRPLPYHERTPLFPGIEVNLRDAGHILGSAIVELFADGRTLVFSGDLGPKGAPILRDPETPPAADLVLMESTYGNRNHKDRADTVRELGGILDDAWNGKGNILIPAFAVGRTQELLYWFARFWDEWKLSRWRIFIDSPMAAKVIRIYDRHHELFDDDARAVWKGTPNPFRLPNLHATESVDESMAINQIRNGAIVIAGNGMASGGRIVHHLRHNIGRREAHIVFVGYQAEGTLGRRLVNGAQWVRLFGEDHRVAAQCHTIGGLSAHTDQAGLLEWYSGIPRHPPVALVHGEDIAREALAGEIRERFGVVADLARPGMTREV
ncbi:MAG: MBL fold metallo-hydrolase [Rudaea sp.]|uniref:MBL fold metallo-hydrolase RNA specificity domain-containing protein n=1 Tax=Rudaea sp. TaxID=2136325 RepID=UPI0039E48F79